MPTLPIIASRPEKDIDSIRSRWNAANLPLVYGISNTKWPTNSEDALIAVTSITDSDGFAQINFVNTDILKRDWVEITGTTNNNGIFQVRAALPTFIILDTPFIENDSGFAQRYYQNYTTLIQVYAGIAPAHEHAATDPISLIGTIEQRPDTNNITLADVHEYVKNKMNTDYNESQASWPNDLNGWTDFYIAWAERFDDSDGTTVTNETSIFTNDTDIDGIIYLHAVQSALQFGSDRGGNMFDHVVFDSTGAYYDASALFMTFFERLKIIDYNNFNVSIILDMNAEYPNLNIIRLEVTEFDKSGSTLGSTITAILRQDYGLYRIDLAGITFQGDTNYIEIVLLDSLNIELSETKTIDIDVECFSGLLQPSEFSAAVVSSFSIVLFWTDNSPGETPTGYEIWRGTSFGNLVLVDTTTSLNTYLDIGLDASTEYFYKVRSLSGDEKGPFSSEDSATTNAFAIQWTPRSAATAVQWFDLAYSRPLDRWCAVSATTTTAMTSDDGGVTWTEQTGLGAGGSFFIGIVWSDLESQFVAVGGGTTKVVTSPDGITWTSRTGVSANWQKVAHNGFDLYVSVSASANRIQSSPNGIDWTVRTAAAAEGWHDVAYSPSLDLWCAVAATPSLASVAIMTSVNGIDWISRTAPNTNSMESIVWVEALSLFVVTCTTGVGNRIHTSVNGIDWISRTSAADNQWFGLAFGNGGFAAVANSGTLDRAMDSVNGTSGWNTRTTEDSTWLAVRSDGTIWVAVANSGANRVMTGVRI